MSKDVQLSKISAEFSTSKKTEFHNDEATAIAAKMKIQGDLISHTNNITIENYYENGLNIVNSSNDKETKINELLNLLQESENARILLEAKYSKLNLISISRKLDPEIEDLKDLEAFINLVFLRKKAYITTQFTRTYDFKGNNKLEIRFWIDKNSEDAGIVIGLGTGIFDWIEGRNKLEYDLFLEIYEDFERENF